MSDFGQKVGRLIGFNRNASQGHRPDLTNANEMRRRTVLCRLVVRLYAHDYRKNQTQRTYQREMPKTNSNLTPFWPLLGRFGPNLGSFSPNPHESTRKERMAAAVCTFHTLLSRFGHRKRSARVVVGLVVGLHTRTDFGKTSRPPAAKKKVARGCCGGKRTENESKRAKLTKTDPFWAQLWPALRSN